MAVSSIHRKSRMCSRPNPSDSHNEATISSFTLCFEYQQFTYAIFSQGYINRKKSEIIEYPNLKNQLVNWLTKIWKYPLYIPL